MRLVILAQLTLLALAGCVSLSSQPTPETRTTTVVTPAPSPPPSSVFVTRP